MERRGFVWLVVVVVAGLALTALVPTYLRRGSDKPPAGASSGTGKGSKEATSYAGTLPAKFTLSGALSGAGAEPGFALPNSTRISVAGDKATASSSREVARLSGVDRLTGKEYFTFNGRFDRKTNRLSGIVVWTLKGRAGDRTMDWRFQGRLDGRFTTSTSVDGILSGEITLSERYLSSKTGPPPTRGKASWEYDGLRGK
jgi:hypothetical protein